MSRTAVSLALKNLLFTVVVPGTVAVYAPLYIVDGPDAWPIWLSFRGVVGCTLLIIGGATYFWCLWDFAHTGRGTPAPIDPPTTLMERGLYRYTRNPMYVGVLTVIAGWGTLFATPALGVYWICVAVGFHLFVVIYEEPHLRTVFGDGYAQYCLRVRRWLGRMG